MPGGRSEMLQLSQLRDAIAAAPLVSTAPHDIVSSGLESEKLLCAIQNTLERESQALRQVAQSAASDVLRAALAFAHRPGKIVCIGVGKSAIVAHKIAATLSSTGTPAIWLNGGDALHGDLGAIDAGEKILFVSKSAATEELEAMMPALRSRSCLIAGVFGATDTVLAKECDIVINVGVEREACPLNLAPTSSTTVAMAIGDALAAALMVARQFTKEQFLASHPSGRLGERLRWTASDVMRRATALPLVSRETPLRDALEAMTAGGLGCAVVCTEDFALQGIITDGDLRRYLVKHDVAEATAADVMTTSPVVVSSSTRLSTILAIMESPMRRITVVPIVDERQCVGLVHIHDILGGPKT